MVDQQAQEDEHILRNNFRILSDITQQAQGDNRNPGTLHQPIPTRQPTNSNEGV